MSTMRVTTLRNESSAVDQIVLNADGSLGGVLGSDLAAKLGTLSVNAQTGTTYTLTTSDPQKVVTVTNAAASTVTIPTNASAAIPIGSAIQVVNLSTGVNTTVSPAGGVTLNGGTVVLSPGSSATLVKIGTDAWMVQGQGAPGLVHIATVAVSAAASTSVNNCFSTAMDNYRLIITGSSSSATDFSIRLRAAGSDNTSSDYAFQQIIANNTTLSGSRSTGQTSAQVAGFGSTAVQGSVIDIFGPALASATYGHGHAVYDTTTNLQIFQRYFQHNVASAFDGFTIFGGSGTFTGTIRVYGYRNA